MAITMKIDTKLTISKPHSNQEEDTLVQLKVEDVSSGARFLTLEISARDLMVAIMGLSATPCTATVRGLDKVGKQQECKDFEFKLPPSEYPTGGSRKVIAEEVVRHVCPEGGTPDIYFGSQSSFFTRDGNIWARTTIRRW